MPLFIFAEPTASVIDGVHTCVCVCLGRSCRGRAPEARRPDHGRQRADSGGGFPRRGRQHPEEDQRNRHAHRAVIDRPHLHTHYTHSLSSAHNSIHFTSAHLFCKLAAAACRDEVLVCESTCTLKHKQCDHEEAYATVMFEGLLQARVVLKALRSRNGNLNEAVNSIRNIPPLWI